jgi:hypothetical protein
MKFYKIRNKNDPTKYRLGGIDPKWNKSGKTWDTLGKLRSMITMKINTKSSTEDLSDWEIVEYKVTEVAAKPVHEVISHKNLLTMLTQ